MDALVHASHVVVCEECLGRHHAACWKGRCACGATGTLGPFSAADLRLDVVAPKLLERPEPARRGARLVALIAVAGLAGSASLYTRIASAPHEAFRREAVLAPAPPPDPDVLAPAPPATEPIEDAAVLCREAWVLDRALDFDGAIAKFTRALELEPDRHEAWLGRAWVHEHRHDHREAIADATRALELRPADVHGFWPRVRGETEVGDLAAALEDCERALALAPEDSVCWSSRAYTRDRMHDYKGAVADGTRAIELSPTNAYAWNNRGFARMRLGELEDAALDIERSLQLDPKNPYAWESRGYLHVRCAGRATTLWIGSGARGLATNHLDHACADFKKALEVDTYHERTADVTKMLDLLDADH